MPSDSVATRSGQRPSLDIPTPNIANLGPLTTTFLPGASCGLVIHSDGSTTGWPYVGRYAQSCLGSNALMDDESCWPPKISYPDLYAPTDGHDPLYGYGFYSPGFICPIGYTRACASAAPSQIAYTDVTGSIAAFLF